MATIFSNALEHTAQAVTSWAEKWFPDAYIFAALAVVVVAAGAWFMGAPLTQIGIAFGDGYWSLIPFTMQMAMVAISGYVLAVSPPAAALIARLAKLPRSGRSAVAFVAMVSIIASFISWAISLIFAGLLVRALARRTDLRMDYRAAGAAAYLGLGATWALGLSSSAAQLQTNPASLPPTLLAITGVLPFSQTIFLPQSMLLALIIMLVSICIAYFSAPRDANASTADDLAVNLDDTPETTDIDRPGDWLERSPLLTLLIVALGALWIWHEFSSKNPLIAITNLNTYNFVLLLFGMLCNWRPQRFLRAVTQSVPSTAGVLIQFPLYGGIAFILTKAGAADGHTLSHYLAQFFVTISTHSSFPGVIGIYSAILGFFVPSGGGKWIIEAPYVMQAAIDLKVHLGWAVTVYNAAEALPNLINPFWMLPLLGILRLKARDIVGYTFVQFIVHVPLVIFLLWALAGTLSYLPPAMP
ncbi:short-chain fatty acid transporter [Solimicrobium silvestre]|uniref:Short chain fatty acids transporter n=1 Tax=Solimicrobium silvestre TaxID=2099400 RepID=A0A2S9GX26_9BURK|nr:TIGR00366 family protein [Solimicrobium silvestre]PRC92277.1 Short chain fatty acids transporter [Solimicrobium silvestre]